MVERLSNLIKRKEALYVLQIDKMNTNEEFHVYCKIKHKQKSKNLKSDQWDEPVYDATHLKKQ